MYTNSHLLIWLLALLLIGPARSPAQAPPWQLAMSSTNQRPFTDFATTSAIATDAAGNVFLTGSFAGSVTFGTTQLTSTGPASVPNVFVAKWDATSQSFTWATSAGGSDGANSTGIAVTGNSIYIVGTFYSSTSVAQFAGQTLTSAGYDDVFVAKYLDTSTGHTAATSSFANGWAVSGGGTGTDRGNGIAVSGNGVYVTGSFASNGFCRLAGQLLQGAGNYDVFVAKYIDTSTGTTPATSSFTNGWAVSGGGASNDVGHAIAVSGPNIFVTGEFYGTPPAYIAGQALTAAGGADMFVAKYIDTSTGSTTSSVANGWATSGGGTVGDIGYGIAVSGRNVFVTGVFRSNSNAIIAGQSLLGAGDLDMFVAKYIDTSTGTTPATSSFANGWATSGGGSYNEVGYNIAVRGPTVLVTGYFDSGRATTIAGQLLPGAGRADVFLARYLDTSTGTTPVTSSFVNGWASSAGGSGSDIGFGLAVSGQWVYVAGGASSPTSFGNLAIGTAGNEQTAFLARLTDPTLPLTTHTPAAAAHTLSPNPAPGGAAVLCGVAPGTAVRVLDALGRVVATATADATGTAALPGGHPPGLYLIRSSSQATRLLVQ